MRRTVLLLASLSVAVLLAGGAALAVTPPVGADENAEAEAAAAARGPDAALDRALKDLVAMEGGPPGIIAVVQRGERRQVHTFGVANLKSERPMRADDRMRLASAAKAFSGAVVVALRAAGADVEVREVPDPQDPDCLAGLSVRGRRTADAADRALAAAIPERHTTRAPFL